MNSNHPFIQRLTDNWKTVLIVFIGVVLFVLFVLPAQLCPPNFPADDSYFYLQVAYNIAHGYGSTFNEITTTNGYHPLWMLLCVAGMFLAGSNKIIALHIIFTVAALLFLVIVYYFFRIAKQISLKYWLLGLPLLATYFLTGLYGSEAHVNGCMLIVAIYYFLLAYDQVERAVLWVSASIFIALFVLARLDNIFLAGTFLLFGLIRIYAGQGINIKNLFDLQKIKLVSAFICPFVVILAAYFLFNLISYGHFVTISSKLKSDFSHISLSIDNLGKLGKLGKLVSLFGALSLFLSFMPGVGAKKKIILRILGIGVLLHALSIFLFSTGRWTSWSWYYVAGVINAAFVLCVAFELIAAKLIAKRIVNQRIINGGVLFACLLLSIVGLSRGWMRYANPDAIGSNNIIPYLDGNVDREYRWDISLGFWLKQNLPPKTKILVADSAGKIAWYSDMLILPGDGLINGYVYNEKLLRLGINEYLCVNNVKYYIGKICPGQNGVYERDINIPLYRKSAGKIKLYDRNIITKVKDIVSHPMTPDWAIWKIENKKQS